MKDWLIIALLAVAAGLVFNAVFPRYEWTVPADGTSVVRVRSVEGSVPAGGLQNDGTLKPWPVFVPF